MQWSELLENKQREHSTNITVSLEAAEEAAGRQEWQPPHATHLPRNIRLDKKTLGLSRDLTRQDPPAARRREFGPKPIPVTKTPPAPPPTRVPGQDPDLAHTDQRQGWGKQSKSYRVTVRDEGQSITTLLCWLQELRKHYRLIRNWYTNSKMKCTNILMNT